MADGGLGNRHPGSIDDEVIGAVDDSRQAVHQHAMALRRNDVEDDGPTLAFKISGPVVVRDYHLGIFRIAAGRDKRAAMFRHGEGHRLDPVIFVVLLVVVAPLG